jgi:hypothetical protein
MYNSAKKKYIKKKKHKKSGYVRCMFLKNKKYRGCIAWGKSGFLKYT